MTQENKPHKKLSDMVRSFIRRLTKTQEDKPHNDKPPATKQAFLAEELSKLIGSYSKDRNRHKNQAVFLKIITVALSASITILLGLKGLAQFDNVIKNLALIFGALITVFSAYEAFFFPRTLWIQETKVFSKMKDLQRQLGYYEAGTQDGEIEEEKLDEIKEGIDKTLQESLEDWLTLRGVQEVAIAPKEKPEEK